MHKHTINYLNLPDAFADPDCPIPWDSPDLMVWSIRTGEQERLVGVMKAANFGPLHILRTLRSMFEGRTWDTPARAQEHLQSTWEGMVINDGGDLLHLPIVDHSTTEVQVTFAWMG